MFGLFGGLAGGSFQAHYRCYPVSFMDKPEAENGNKIFLPSSALDRLASLHIEYPMLFKVESRGNGRSTHCGVLEFSADEGMVYMPYWMMQNLLVEEGAVVTVSSASLPKGSYVKLQPHTSDFLDISNPKAVLETTLRDFSCLTKGDCICLHYNNKKYYIDIIEARPDDAISVIETDCEVDFAPPLDYVEPKREERPPAPAPTADGAGPSAAAAEEPEAAQEEPKFLAFVGAGRRLDGRPAVGGPPVPVTPSVGIRRPPAPAPVGSGAAGEKGAANGAEAGNRPGQKSGKVVFGSTGNRLLDKKMAADKPKPAPKAEEKKEEESKFKPFTGKPRSLRD
ncbi:Ubiquitin recognition factor in ER-associated degradation [Coccomyxa sp. Obi]|nr:Ubiquitin recognition factor in ER-associated degradation [Coccomyxa sp. Obi]